MLIPPGPTRHPMMIRATPHRIAPRMIERIPAITRIAARIHNSSAAPELRCAATTSMVHHPPRSLRDVGFAAWTGGLGRLAGALGIAGLVLFAIQVFRASGQHLAGLDTRIEVGAWLALAGSVILLIAGFLSTPESTAYET